MLNRLRGKSNPLIICFHSGKLHEETVRTVNEFAPSARFVDTSSDPYAFGKALEAHWNSGRDLITIEQDMVLTAEVIPSFAMCKQGWCTYSYQGPSTHGYLYTGLGCAKFSKKLQKRFSPFGKHFVTYELVWYLVDEYVRRTLQTLNFINPHVHGHIEHLHPYEFDKYTPFALYCNEKQPDGRTILKFKNNPDGTRDKFMEAVSAPVWRR